MKKIIIACFSMLVALVANSQTINNEIFEGKAYVAVDMQCESTDLGDISIMLDKKAAKKFVKDLHKSLESAKSMAANAKKKGVKSYNKTMQGSFEFSKLFFENQDGENVADYNYNNYLVPYFNVDSQGNSYLLLGGYYSGYNTSNMGSNYNKRNKFFFYVKIPVEKGENWCGDMDLAIADLNNTQKKVNDDDILVADNGKAGSTLSNQINSEGGFFSILSVITAPPYGIIILVAIIALIAVLVLKKKKK